MSETVLIAGGSGLVGKALSEELLHKGFKVKLLGRRKSEIDHVETFVWDPTKKEIDKEALIGTDYIVNLAGANVGEGKWTNQRKKELVESRTLSTSLLVNTIKSNNYPVKKMIQASAIGFYGFSEEDIEYMETDEAGTDFLALLCKEWEKAAEPIHQTNTQLMIVRIGVVLSNKGGALMAMAKPIKMFAGAYLGTGKQIVPWIHIDDLVAIILNGLLDPNYSGVINAAAPDPISNKQLTRLIGKAIKRPVWPIGVPAFVLKLMLGEQAQIVLKGNRISAKKLIHLGFQFVYSQPDDAIKKLFAGN